MRELLISAYCCMRATRLGAKRLRVCFARVRPCGNVPRYSSGIAARRAERSMPFDLAVSDQIRLEYEKSVPGSSGPVVDVNGEGVLGEIAPVVHEDAQLHDDHRDDHPLPEVLIFAHRWSEG